jgi:hypothetical protein
VLVACALLSAITAFGQGVSVSFPNGNPGDWTSLDPNNNTTALAPTTSSSGGPTGGGYTVINNLFPGADGGAYSFYGVSELVSIPTSKVSQSVAIYLDPAKAVEQSGGLTIDMTPDATVNTSAYGTPQLWGAETQFQLNGTGPGVTVNANGGSTFATISSAGWYDFNITWKQGLTGTDPVIATLSVYGLNGVDNLFDISLGSTTSVNNSEDTADNQSQNLGGAGYVWFTYWSNGFADAAGDPGSLEVADLAASPVPEPSTIIAGAMMLLPFGASTLRTLRRKIAA